MLLIYNKDTIMTGIQLNNSQKSVCVYMLMYFEDEYFQYKLNKKGHYRWKASEEADRWS